MNAPLLQPPAPAALFTGRFFLMCGFTFTVFLSAFQLLPTAPFHILELGGSKFAAGLFLGLLTYSSAFSAPLTGGLADRFGLPATAAANFTTGGAEANLSAVIVALTRAFPDYGEHGLRRLSSSPTIYLTREAHHSFNKIAHITRGDGAPCARPPPRSTWPWR